ncbi:MAG: hypothetical protein H6759_05660 [Candidatus Nomurabacteria bacterium]|nr:MAG: hypothetical protein H6759_05660 [Candidatus Nomurabacteria bacterium]
MKTWVRKQAVDIIFLELHWPRTIIHYSYHELWLVTAPPAKSLRQLLALQLKPKNPVKQKPEDKLEQKPEDQGLKPEDQEYKTEDQVLLRIKAGYAAAQALWGRSFQVLPKEKFFISNASHGRNAIRYRLHKRIKTIAMCYEDGRYEDEDERTTLSPPA